jgi:tetratricopeptide (TPR) repeat protein
MHRTHCRILRALLLLPLAFLTTLPAVAATPAATQADPLLAIEHQWAHINYQLPSKQRDDAFAALGQRAAKLSAAEPDRAGPKVWQAIILSSRAGVHGGFGALSMVKQARKLLLAAEKIDPTALHGSIYTSLGSLYDQVPGWPLGFGDKAKARQNLQKALQINPDGIDPNYFYALFLHHHGHDRAALTALHKALQAPARPQRPLADSGRRKDIQQLIAKIKAHG